MPFCVCMRVAEHALLWIVQCAFEGKSTKAKYEHRLNKNWSESTQLYQWHLLLAHMISVRTVLIPIEICQEESCQ